VTRILKDPEEAGAPPKMPPAASAAQNNGNCHEQCNPSRRKRNTVPRKPTGRETDIFHNRPAAHCQKASSAQVFKLWKRDGYYIRELSWKFRVRSRDIEDIIRDVA